MARNHHGTEPSKNDTDTESFLEFINALFGECEGPINIATLLNAGGAGPQITSDDTEALKNFVIKHDRPGWGVYCAVSTMVDTKHHHSKEAINEIPSLHIDIDSKDIDDSKADVIKKLKTLRLPPTLINDSGNGIHCYWKFREALGPDEIERIEDALKQLCDLVGGDIKVTQPSAVMRLPGTLNTKREPQEVRIVWKNDGDGKAELVTYELSDIEEWLAEASPIILRKERPQAKTAGQDNYFSEYAKQYGLKTPTDVKARLNAMMFMGGLDSSIHVTQLSVTASMMLAGQKDEEIVKLVMEATKAAAGGYWERWNHKREERKIRRMIADGRKKNAAGKPGASIIDDDEDEDEQEELKTAGGGKQR